MDNIDLWLDILYATTTDILHYMLWSQLLTHCGCCLPDNIFQMHYLEWNFALNLTFVPKRKHTVTASDNDLVPIKLQSIQLNNIVLVTECTTNWTITKIGCSECSVCCYSFGLGIICIDLYTCIYVCPIIFMSLCQMSVIDKHTYIAANIFWYVFFIFWSFWSNVTGAKPTTEHIRFAHLFGCCGQGPL